MGVKNLSALLKDKSLTSTIKLEDLFDLKIGFDAFNQLFQFLSSIRDSSGNSLVDDQGQVTSHLVGILNRGSSMLQNNIKPVYVFDGKSHELKSDEKARRREVRALAEIEYEKAIAEGNLERAKMLSKRINRLTPEMVEDSKTLLNAMGIPIIQAPGEGEAQAAQLTKEGTIYATSSQDYDTLLFGSPRLIRNLNIVGRRRLPSGQTKIIYPEQYQLSTVLQTLNLSQEQLIDLGILMGTDFNTGFEKVGPKTAYKFITKYGSFENVKENEEKIQAIEIPYETIKGIFHTPNVEKNLTVDFDQEYDIETIKQFLSDKNFDLGRYNNLLKKTHSDIKRFKSQTQTSLDDWF